MASELDRQRQRDVSGAGSDPKAMFVVCKQGGLSGAGGVLSTMHGRSLYIIDPRIPTKAGTEHAGLTLTTQN